MTSRATSRSVRPMSPAEAEQVAQWRYAGRWSRYDLESAAPILGELGDFRSVIDAADGTLVGFCCVGTSARVADLPEDPALVDVGVGMNPDLIGQGNGAEFGTVVMDHLARAYPGRSLRAVIQAWNQRSLRFTRRLGFVDTGEMIVDPTGNAVSYRILVMPHSTTSLPAGPNKHR